MEMYIENYNNFIEQLKIIFSDNNTISILNENLSLEDNIKIEKGNLFRNKINDIDFNSFYNNKIKIFSHKDDNTLVISQSLFSAELCIKNLLNNQPEEVKTIIWKHLHTIWLYSEYLNETPNNDNIKLMKTKLFGEQKLEFIKTDARKKLQDLLGVEVNLETTEMIDDIIGCFEDLFNGSTGNPMANILKISQTISNKYSNKIKNGNIEIDKIMEAILGKLPGMENIVSKFKNMKVLFEKPKQKNTIIIDENFSTADVIIGEIPNEEPSMKIGSMLKIADKFGIIPGGASSSNSDNPSLGNLFNSDFLNMDKMMGLMKNMQNSDDVGKIQNEMDNFLQNELGLDMTKINEQLNNVILSNDILNENNISK